MPSANFTSLAGAKHGLPDRWSNRGTLWRAAISSVYKNARWTGWYASKVF